MRARTSIRPLVPTAHRQPGNVVRVRQRTWLVQDVETGERRDDATLVRLACIDDDAAGEGLEVLWETEIAPEIVPDEPFRSRGQTTSRETPSPPPEKRSTNTVQR